MTTTINQNILDVTEGVIVHQVNCKGVFNAGLAKQIAQKWPKVKEAYLDQFGIEGWRLGQYQPVYLSRNLTVINLAGQDFYRGYGQKGVYTSYPAIRAALESIKIGLAPTPITAP